MRTDTLYDGASKQLPGSLVQVDLFWRPHETLSRQRKAIAGLDCFRGLDFELEAINWFYNRLFCSPMLCGLR